MVPAPKIYRFNFNFSIYEFVDLIRDQGILSNRTEVVAVLTRLNNSLFVNIHGVRLMSANPSNCNWLQGAGNFRHQSGAAY